VKAQDVSSKNVQNVPGQGAKPLSQKGEKMEGKKTLACTQKSPLRISKFETPGRANYGHE
jgi:hypothetical protein